MSNPYDTHEKAMAKASSLMSDDLDGLVAMVGPIVRECPENVGGAHLATAAWIVADFERAVRVLSLMAVTRVYLEDRDTPATTS